MKKVKLTSFGAFAALALLASCDEGMDFGNMTGTILPTVNYDATVMGASNAGSRVSEFDQLTVDDLTLTLTSADGSLSEEFSAGAFPSDRGFAVGKYTLTASYGDVADEGFEKPAVYGEAQLTVSEGKATKVELTAVPSKAMVGITYDEAALNYFTDLKASLHSAGGQTVAYTTDETRYAYLMPGEITIDVTFTKPNGKGGTIEVAKFTAEAQHRYTLDVKLGGDGAGETGITISFDETLEMDDITVDISDELLSVPAPEVTLSGVTPGETLYLVSGSPLTEALRVDIKAQGSIKSAVLTTTGTDQNLPAGWPAEIDLASATTDQQQVLTDLGFKNIGIFNNPGKFAAFDLSGVIANMPATGATASPVTFALKVTDQNGKVASDEPLTFSVKIDKIDLSLEAIEGYAYAGEETIDVLVSYNGTANLKDVLTVKYLATTGTMKTATIADVQTYGRTAQTYIVSVTVPSDAQLPIILQATAGDITTDEVSIPQAPAPVIACSENDVFALSAWVQVSSESYDVAQKDIEIEIATGSGSYVKASGEQSGSEFHITDGLTPSTTYQVRARIGALVSESVTFTTEAATEIPGGDMEDWTTSDISCGAYGGTNYTPASPWATLNTLTTSAINVLDGRSYHVGTLYDNNGHTGKAAVVRTVGWKATGSTPYNKQPEVQTAGELFLGEYDDAAVYGIDFESRPSALTFYGKFAQFNDGDQGFASIEVLDSSNNRIAYGEATPSNTDYEKITISLSYSRGAAKAKKLLVKFRSSDKETLSSSDVSTLTTGLFVSHTQHATGASFYVDDIELVY